MKPIKAPIKTNVDMKSSESSKPRSDGPQPAIQKATTDISRFAAPEDVLIDRDLGRRERVRLLEDWKVELEQLATATEEKVPRLSSRSGRAPEELLRRVNACRRILKEQET